MKAQIPELKFDYFYYYPKQTHEEQVKIFLLKNFLFLYEQYPTVFAFNFYPISGLNRCYLLPFQIAWDTLENIKKTEDYQKQIKPDTSFILNYIRRRVEEDYPAALKIPVNQNKETLHFSAKEIIGQIQQFWRTKTENMASSHFDLVRKNMRELSNIRIIDYEGNPNEEFELQIRQYLGAELILKMEHYQINKKIKKNKTQWADKNPKNLL